MQNIGRYLLLIIAVITGLLSFSISGTDGQLLKWIGFISLAGVTLSLLLPNSNAPYTLPEDEIPPEGEWTILDVTDYSVFKEVKQAEQIKQLGDGKK